MTHCVVTQGFGQNFNGTYRSFGLNGHPGVDEICGYGSDVRPYMGGKVISVYTPEQPSSNGYTCVFILCENDLEIAEHSIGHLSEVLVKVGDWVTTDTIIGKEGNKGLVFVGGQQITVDMQRAGDKRGHHRHVQWRPVIKQKDTSKGIFLLNNGGYVRADDGSAYKIYDYNNGYNGLVDPFAEFWPNDLFVGSKGYGVYLLQKALLRDGFADYDPTGYYGPKTMASVAKLQRSEGITPTGYFGPKTRGVYNKKYKRIK
jgi:hypothetical protein